MDKLKSIAVNAAFIALVSIVLIWGVTFYRQYVQFEKGEKGFAAGNFVDAVAGYESAIHMYTPLSPLVDRSAEKLWTIGEMFAQRGDLPRALIAYRELRSSIYSIAWLYSPGQEWIGKCDERINQILQQQAGQKQ